MQKTINLSMEFSDFIEFVQYTQSLPDNSDPQLLKFKEMLWQKFDRIVEHDLYSKYKSAPTESEREKARQAYLDRRGIPANFRW